MCEQTCLYSQKSRQCKWRTPKTDGKCNYRHTVVLFFYRNTGCNSSFIDGLAHCSRRCFGLFLWPIYWDISHGSSLPNRPIFYNLVNSTCLLVHCMVLDGPCLVNPRYIPSGLLFDLSDWISLSLKLYW